MLVRLKEAQAGQAEWSRLKQVRGMFFTTKGITRCGDLTDNSSSIRFSFFKSKIRTHLDLLSIPQSGGKNVKTFRWGHRLQIQNLFMAFKRVFPYGSNIGSTVV